MAMSPKELNDLEKSELEKFDPQNVSELEKLIDECLQHGRTSFNLTYKSATPREIAAITDKYRAAGWRGICITDNSRGITVRLKSPPFLILSRINRFCRSVLRWS